MSSGKQFFLLWFRTRLLTCDKHRELSSLIGNQTLSCDRYQAYVLSWSEVTVIYDKALDRSSILDATLCNFQVDSFLTQRLRFLIMGFDSGDLLAKLVQYFDPGRQRRWSSKIVQLFNLMQYLIMNLTRLSDKLKSNLKLKSQWERERSFQEKWKWSERKNRQN